MRYPWCLKETISPLWGFLRFANCVVPTAATNVTPFGLTERGVSQVVYVIVCDGEFTVHIPIGACRWLESLELLRLGISVVVIFSYHTIPIQQHNTTQHNTAQYITLCFKNPGHLPGFKAALGSRKMIPSPPLSTTS